MAEREVRVKLYGIDDMVKRFPLFVQTLQKTVAKETPTNVVSNILRGRAGLNDLAPVTKNEPSTINRKRARGKPALSLVDNKVLTNVNNWSIKRSGGNWKVQPKSARRKISFYLHQGIRSNRGPKIYNFMLKPKAHQPAWLLRIMSRENKKFFARYV